MGAGFLFDDFHILTCAHVIELALGRAMGTVKEAPSETITVQFVINGTSVTGCTVVNWIAVVFDPSNYALEDVAVLRLPSARPSQLTPITLSEEHPVFRSEVAAYNMNEQIRAWSYARFGFARPNGSIQLTPDSDGVAIAEGCSGGPALDLQTQEVRGLIVSARRDGTAAWCIPVDQLAQGVKEFPPLLTRPLGGNSYRVSLSRSWPSVFPYLAGREEELERITTARCAGRTAAYAIIGAGGDGKTAILKAWLRTISESPMPSVHG